MPEYISGSESMATRFYGVVIDVNNMDRVRPFYLHTLELGKPVVESNFWVEFQAPGSNLIIALRQTREITTEKGKGTRNMVVCLHVKKRLAEFQDQLAAHGITNVRKIEFATGTAGLEFNDPEGNRIIAIQPE